MNTLVKTFIASSLAAGMSLAAFAQASQVGEVSSAAGDVVVQRGAKTYSLSAGNAVLEGDVIQVGPSGSIKISAFGCERSVPAGSTVTLGAGFCAPTPTKVVETTTTGTTAGGGGMVLGGLAAAGAVAAIAGGGGGGGSDSPTSP